MAGPDDDRDQSPDQPGRLLASGRAADVYDLGDGTVLRRYRAGRHDPRQEARVMEFVANQGISVPQVLELRAGDDPETDIVMQRIDGITMLEDLERRPWMVLPHARLLARLQREIGAVDAPDWMMSPGWTPRDAEDGTHADRVLHMDLHPGNVLLAPHGPVVIDWANSTGGPPGFDAAMSYVAMATFEVDAPPTRIAQQIVVAMFRRAAGRRIVDAFLAAACDHRLADPNLTPGERINVAALRKRARVNRTG